MRDHFTGLYSKNWFFEILPKEMSKARRYKTELSICIGNISEFYTIKYNLGYLSCDRLITIISSILHSNSRKSDFCCRYDNQFAIVLPETKAYGACVYTGRIDDLLKHKNFYYGESKTDINIDWGVCQFNPLLHPTAGSMIESAFSFQKINNT